MRGNAAIQGVPIVLASKLDAAANAEAEVLVSGVAGDSHVLVGIEYSYAGGTPVGKLTITDGSTIIKEWDVTGEGHWSIDFSTIGSVRGIPMTVGADLKVELGAAGADAVGKLSVTYR